MTSETELAWAAGFFEGEGCISSARPRAVLRIRAAVSQNGPHAPAILQRFVDAVGFGKVLGPYDYSDRYENTPTKLPRYVVQYQTDEQVAKLMLLLGPHFTSGSPKVRRYAVLLAEAQREKGGERTS